MSENQETGDGMECLVEAKGLRQADVARGRDTCLRQRMLGNRSGKANESQSRSHNRKAGKNVSYVASAFPTSHEKDSRWSFGERVNKNIAIRLNASPAPFMSQSD